MKWFLDRSGKEDKNLDTNNDNNEEAKQTDVEEANVTMALVGKLASAMSNNKDKTLEEEKEILEMNEEEDDAVKKESGEEDKKVTQPEAQVVHQQALYDFCTT